MSEPTRRVWRASPATLVLVWIFALAAGLVIPILAYLVYRNAAANWIPVLLGGLTLLALAYVWRFGLHPRLRITDHTLEIVNPFRRHRFAWDDITVIAPGENGLVVGSDDQVAEAWCIQKSNFAARRGHLTRADRVANDLLDILDLHDPPLEDDLTGLRIRRARPHEPRLLTRLERAASEDALAHVFPGEEYPYPVAEVTRRWRRELRDPAVRIYLLELHDAPLGYVAFDQTTILHLGVAEQHVRRGYGSALLEFASLEIYANGTDEAELWVLLENRAARDFYAAAGWTERTERRRSEFPPHPEALRMTRRNRAAPRRSR